MSSRQFVAETQEMKCCCFTLYAFFFFFEGLILLMFYFSSFSPFSPKGGHADFLPPSFPMMSSCEYVSAELVTFTEICWCKVE